MSAADYLLFLAASLLLALSPGPNNLMSFGNGLKLGLGAALRAVLGRLLAFAILIGLTAVGLGALLATSESALVWLKWIGVAYLIYLGLRSWFDRGEGSPAPTHADFGHLARREFLVAISNPKAILIFTAFFPQFLVAGEPSAPQLLQMGAGFLCVEFLAAGCYALAGLRLARLGERLGRAPSAQRVNRISGGLLLGAGALLATSQR